MQLFTQSLHIHHHRTTKLHNQCWLLHIQLMLHTYLAQFAYTIFCSYQAAFFSLYLIFYAFYICPSIIAESKGRISLYVQGKRFPNCAYDSKCFESSLVRVQVHPCSHFNETNFRTNRSHKYSTFWCPSSMFGCTPSSCCSKDETSACVLCCWVEHWLSDALHQGALGLRSW